MPRNIIGGSPFPVQTIECNEPLTLTQITAGLRNALGVSLCVRTTDGHNNRGGYFFHIETVDHNYRIYDFEKKEIIMFDQQNLVRFVNHVSGRQFDPEMLVICQSAINFRQD